MGRKPEALFQSQVIAYLKRLYGPRFCHSNTVAGLGARAGIPDPLCCIDGRFVALELKSQDLTRGHVLPDNGVGISDGINRKEF